VAVEPPVGMVAGTAVAAREAATVASVEALLVAPLVVVVLAAAMEAV